MAGFWGKRKREEQQAAAEQDQQLGKRADAALVATDERIRVSTDELAFAVAELGEGPTKDLRDALVAVRQHLGEAFQLNQLNHDEIPDTPEELRTRNARILQLCEWGNELLDDRTAVLESAIERARRAPEILRGIIADVERLRERLPQAQLTVERLHGRYAADAIHKIERNAREAEELLNFAEHGAGISTRRREAGQREQANLALEAATEAVRRAGTLVDAVENYEIEALRAESTLDAVIEDSRDDLIEARTAPQVPAVTSAMAALQAALGALPAPGVPSDPFAELTQLREANAALDAAVAKARERAARPLPDEKHIQHAIDDADRQLAIARSVVSGHRGWIGADARTRLAEAERIRQELAPLAGVAIPEDDRERAMTLARRCGLLAAEALQLAQRDIDSSRPSDNGPGQNGWGGGGGRGNNAMGGILGGLVIGSLLGDIFD